MNSQFAALSNKDLCVSLSERVSDLPAKDRDFAESLISSVASRGHSASDKQRYWLVALLDRTVNGEPERVKTAIGNMGGIMALFDKARKHLKAPAIVIGVAGRELRLNVAGPSTRAPGTVNVATNADWDSRTWFGRILQSGEFEASPRDPTPEGLVEGLQRFAADPAGVAAEHGKLTGKCCFCNKQLTDDRSAAVGYGKTCAGHYSMPYPSMKEARASTRNLFAEAA